MHIGLIAREFPPAVGGMQAVARHLAYELAGTDELTVFTRRGYGVSQAPFEQRAVLTGDLTHDLPHLRSERPDVWLALNAGYAAIGGELDGPVSVYCHGNDLLRLNVSYRRGWQEAMRTAPYIWRYRKPLVRPLRRRAMRRGLKCVNRVFANSENTAELVRLTYNGSAPEITVVPPGVEDVYFGVRKDAEVSDRQSLRLLTVSRLQRSSARKNVDGVLRAVAQLPAEVRWEYTVIGDGDDRGRLEALADELGIRGRVCFRGRVPNEDLLDAYRAADLFILASKGSADDIEGFGIVYVESSACGTPVLGSREGGATDAICDGVNGILIDRSDPDSIAAGIRRFLSVRNALGPEKVRGFAEDFRWPNVAQRVRHHLLAIAENNAAHL